jgi:hypothetical protein
MGGVTVHKYISTDMFTNCLKAIWNKYDMTNVKIVLYTQGLCLDINKLSFFDKETIPDQQLVDMLDDVPPPTMIEIREDEHSDKEYKQYQEESKTTPLIILSMTVGITNANGIKYSINLYHTENRRTSLSICCKCKELCKKSHVPNDDVNIFGSSKCVYNTCEKKGCLGKLITNIDLYLEHEKLQEKLNDKNDDTS